jgi:hypothetical protein
MIVKSKRKRKSSGHDLFWFLGANIQLNHFAQKKKKRLDHD